ncbi:MAG TPA: response regulator [Usitatibacter sp.]|nr:response regulator [Usitatibacter sp.]
MIYIVDDEEPIRDSLAWLLRSRGLESRAFESAEAFLAYLQSAEADRTRPACLLLDIRMAGMSGMELFERLCASGISPSWPAIFLTGHGDVPMAVGALKMGAFDFVEKPFNDNSLVDRIQAALEASAQRLESERSARSVEERLATLTPRERDVMELILEGRYNKVIADRLGIAQRTVEVYRARILEKMGAKTAVELAAMVAERRR